MAVKSVVVSDVSGREIPDSEHAVVTVSGYPGTNGTIELDVSTTEASKFESSNLELVTLTIHGNGSRRSVVMTKDAFNKTFKADTDVPTLLRGARRSSDGGTQRRGRATSSASKGERVDYSSPERAGDLHRGRITEAEAEYVRNNLDKVNARLKAEGGRHIDPKDPTEKKRYGFK